MAKMNKAQLEYARSRVNTIYNDAVNAYNTEHYLDAYKPTLADYLLSLLDLLKG